MALGCGLSARLFPAAMDEVLSLLSQNCYSLNRDLKLVGQ